ncbi:MAG: recombinase family protein [Pseudomonadota bacterium]
MKAVGYCRVSSRDQVDGTSLDAQRNAVTAYAVMRGLDLIEVFTDEAISGGKPLSERPEGAAMCALIEAGEVDCVVITKLDRGFRNVVDCLQTIDMWDAANVGLHIVDLGGNSVDTKTTMGRYMITMFAAAAELERGLIRDRCNGGRKVCKAEGKRVGEIPYGYTLGADGKTLVEDSTEQEGLRLIHDLNAQGYSLREIADEMNKRQYAAKKGGKWSFGQVRTVLKRAA